MYVSDAARKLHVSEGVKAVSRMVARAGLVAGFSVWVSFLWNRGATW